MKTSCLLCRVVSVLHLCRKNEKKKKERTREREPVYAINMKQLSSGSTAYSMALILPLHP